MERVRRITIDDVTSAYNKIGYTYKSKVWVEEETKECCPVSAVALAKGASAIDLNNMGHGRDYALRSVGLNVAYTDGFSDAIDGKELKWRWKILLSDFPIEVMGYRDGLIVKEALENGVAEVARKIIAETPGELAKQRKKYVVTKVEKHYTYIEVLATSEEEALEIAKNNKGIEFDAHSETEEWEVKEVSSAQDSQKEAL